MFTLQHAVRSPGGVSVLGRAITTSSHCSKEWFSHVPEAAKDPILGISENFLADPHPDKINLGVGAYRDNNGKPMVLDCVRKAEKLITGLNNMEYLPMGGSKDFNRESVKLAFGDDNEVLRSNRVAAVQTLSGTGACRLFADFQHRYLPGSKVYIPVPTWSNHHNVWADAGVKEGLYRYYKKETRGLDFEGMMEDIKAAPNGSVFLLHACAHNPTGVDPTIEQWKAISKLMLEKSHFPILDMAYQMTHGFASGDCDRDAASVRIFAADGHSLACSQSYAKNLGLYGQRIGCLSIVCDNPKEAAAVESQIKFVARPMYSNPPMHGAMIVTKVLADAELKKQWFGEVKSMADRIIAMRLALRNNLEKAGSEWTWNHVTDQIGMFAYSGMTPEMVDTLARQHHIYMTRNGRISMAGVNTSNVERLAAAIHKVTAGSPAN
ncbi:MAG: hypothetical protein WDW38_007303 [Sanguina aurantia]